MEKEKPVISVIVSEAVADACRRKDPVFETVMDVAIGAFKDLGVDPSTHIPQLESIERREDEYGEFYTVNFSIRCKDRGPSKSLAAMP